MGSAVTAALAPLVCVLKLEHFLSQLREDCGLWLLLPLTLAPLPCVWFPREVKRSVTKLPPSSSQSWKASGVREPHAGDTSVS